MKCLGCEEEDSMERQDDYVTDNAGKIVNKSALYACMSCGREYYWELGVPGLKPLFDSEDFLSPLPAWGGDDAEKGC